MADSVQRFDDRAADYVKYRPSYPAPAIDRLLEGLAPPETLLIVDVGAGTGISSRLLGDRGAWVVAVEPGVEMRQAALAHPRVSWLAGLATALPVRSMSADLVVCAQAFHWFHTTDAVRELARVLTPGGRLALMWNRRRRDDPLTEGYRQAILDAGGEIAAERMPFDPEILRASGAVSAPDRFSVANMQRLDLDGFIGRARSASYVPKTGDAGARLVARLTDLHARYADADGRVSLMYETEVFRSVRTLE